MQKIEKDKLYYFILAYNNPQKVLVVRSPETDKELKQFRGYEWKGGKGSEGIKYNGGDTVEKIITPLFDPQNRYNKDKINFFIQQNYLGQEIDDKDGLFKMIPLVDLLRFKDKKFNKRIWLSQEHQITINSKWELVKLDNICTIVRGASPRPIDKYITEDSTGVNWIKIGDVNENDKYITKTAEKILQKGAEKSRYVHEGDFILSNSMSFGRPYILKISGCIHDGWLLFTNFSNKVNKDYLYEILSYESTQIQFYHSAAGGIVKNLNKERVQSTKIPLPKLEVQNQIVQECEMIDKEYEKATQEIEETKTEIANKVGELFIKGKNTKLQEIVSINKESFNPTTEPEKEFIYIDIDSVENGTGIINYKQVIKGENAPSRARRIAPKNSVVISTVRPNLKGFAYVDKNTKGCVFSTGFAILESKNENVILNISLFYAFMYSKPLMKQMEEAMLKSSYPSINKSDIENFLLQIPNINIQKNIIKEIEQQEDKIKKAQAVIDSIPERKQEVIKKYL